MNFYEFEQVNYSLDYLESLHACDEYENEKNCGVASGWHDKRYTSDNYKITGAFKRSGNEIYEDIYCLNSKYEIIAFSSYKENKKVICEICPE